MEEEEQPSFTHRRPRIQLVGSHRRPKEIFPSDLGVRSPFRGDVDDSICLAVGSTLRVGKASSTLRVEVVILPQYGESLI